MGKSFSMCFSALDYGGLHSLASNSSKSFFKMTSSQVFTLLYSIENSLMADFYRSSLKVLKPYVTSAPRNYWFYLHLIHASHFQNLSRYNSVFRMNRLKPQKVISKFNDELRWL